MLKSICLVLLMIMAVSNASLETWKKLHAEKNTGELLAHLGGKYVANSKEEHDKAVAENLPVVLHHDVKAIADRVRVVGPGAMMTMDYVEDRLNVHLDKNNKVENVRYG